MGAIGSKVTLMDVATMKDPSGRLGRVAEILQQTNPILQHMPIYEGNLDTGQMTIQRTALGSPSWRRINEEVAPSKATQTQVNDVCGMLEDYTEVDEKLLKMSGDKEGFMLSQSRAKMEAMSQEVASTLIYGNVLTSPKEFHGFVPRMDALNTTIGANPIVLSGGGSQGDNCSILIAGWGEGKVYGIYPKGSMAGLTFENLGKVTKETTSGLREVYRAHHVWEIGLTIEDPRYAIRIANIDVSDLSGIGTSTDASADVFNLLIDAISYIPNPDACDLRIYVPRVLWAAMSKKANEVGNRGMQTSIVDGKMVTSWMGYPVHRIDAMLTNETAVS